MAAGVVVLSGGLSINVDSSSCYHVAKALSALRPNDQTGFACDSEPVVQGTSVMFSYSTDPFMAQHTVVEIDASPMGTADLGDRSQDWVSPEFLLQSIIVIMMVLFLFLGYRSGDKL